MSHASFGACPPSAPSPAANAVGVVEVALEEEDGWVALLGAEGAVERTFGVGGLVLLG